MVGVGGDPWKEHVVAKRVCEKEVWVYAGMKDRDRVRKRDMAKDQGLPTPPASVYSQDSLDNLSLVTDHSANENGPLFLLSGAVPHWSGYNRSRSVPADRARGQLKGNFTRTGPDRNVKITPGLCGTLQHEKYQNNFTYLDTLNEPQTDGGYKRMMEDPQAPTRTLDGRDPFASAADQATHYLPRHAKPPEDISKVGVWKMKTVLGKVIWFLDSEEDRKREAMSFQDSLAQFRSDFVASNKDQRRTKDVRNRARTYEPRNPNGGWYVTNLGSC
jgi:hypothetical protein